MAQAYKAGIIITGDARGGVTAIQATQAEVKKLGATTKRTAKESISAFDSLKKSIFSMQTQIGLLVGTAGLTALIAKNIEAGDQVQKLSQRLDASTEALSQYRHIAERTGVTFEQLTMGWQRQTRRIAEAAQGTGEAKKALDELGLSASALAKLAPEKQFEILADAITGVAEQSDRVRLAQKLWDSEGVKLLQTIQGGSKALREMRQEAHELGLTLTRVQADAMARASDEMTKFGSAADGLAQSLTIYLLPAITSVTEALGSMIQSLGDGSALVDMLDALARASGATIRRGSGDTPMSMLRELAGGVGKESLAAQLSLVNIEIDRVSKSLQTNRAAFAAAGQSIATGVNATDSMRVAYGELWRSISSGEVALATLGETQGEIIDKLKAFDKAGNRTIKTQGKIAKGFTAAEKEAAQFEKTLSSLIDRLDPIGAKTRKYMEDVEMLNRAWVEGRISGEQYESLIFKLASGIESTSQTATKTVVELTEKADPYAEAWINSFQRVDDAFADLWKGAFDSFEDFGDALKNAFFQLLAELAHAATTQQLLIQLGLSGTGAAGGTGGIAGLLGNFFGGGGSGSGIMGNLGSLGNLIGGLFGGGAGAVGGLGGFGAAAGATNFFGLSSTMGLLGGAGGAAAGAAGNFFGLSSTMGLLGGAGGGAAGAAGAAGAGLAGAGIGSMIATAIPYIGWAYAAFSLISSLMQEAPSPRFGVSGGLGNVSVNWSRDIEEAGAQQAVQIMVDAINAYEQRIYSSLDEGQRAAIEDYKPLDLKMIAPDSEHEMGMAMATRISGILEQIDMELAKQWDMAVYEKMWSPEQIASSGIGDLSLTQLYEDFQKGIVHEVGGETTELVAADLDELYNEILLPVFGPAGDEAQKLADELQRLADLEAAYNRVMADTIEQYDRLTMSDFQLEMRDISTWLMQATEAAEEYGAAVSDLALIQEVARLRTEKAIESFTADISKLTNELYGGSDDGTSALDLRISMEQERIANQQAAATELYNTEMARYRDAQTALNSVNDFLVSIQTGSLSPLTPAQQLNSARSEYASTLALAMSGDPGALADIISRSGTLLTTSQSFFGSSAGYKSDFAGVNQDLLGLAQELGLITEPGALGDISTSSLLQMLEQQRIEIDEQKKRDERRLLAEELASKIGELALATGQDVFELMDRLSIDINSLADDLGLSLDVIDTQLLIGLTSLADSFHIDLVDLAVKLGVDLQSLVDVVGGSYAQMQSDFAGFFKYFAEGQSVTSNGLTYTRGPGETGTLTTPSGTVYNFTQSGGISGLANQSPEYSDSLRDNYGVTPASQGVLDIYNQMLLDFSGFFQYFTEGQQTTNAGITYIRGPGDTATMLTDSGGSYDFTRYETVYNLAKRIPDYAEALRESYGIDILNYSFAKGTSYVPQDMMAMIHQGEIIIDRASSDALRAATRYGLPTSAANDELVDEVRSLRSEVVALRVELGSQHNQASTQRSAQIQAVEGAAIQQRRLVSRSVEASKAMKRA